MALLNMLALNGQEFTDQGRTFSEILENREVGVETARGVLNKYIKAQKKTYSLAWVWLPNSADETYDGKSGRDGLRDIAYGSGPYTCTLRYGTGIITNTTVWVESYSEDLLRRDFLTNGTFWNIRLDLKER